VNFAAKKNQAPEGTRLYERKKVRYTGAEGNSAWLMKV
jgi:hypothetical protein